MLHSALADDVIPCPDAFTAAAHMVAGIGDDPQAVVDLSMKHVGVADEHLRAAVAIHYLAIRDFKGVARVWGGQPKHATNMLSANLLTPPSPPAPRSLQVVDEMDDHGYRPPKYLLRLLLASGVEDLVYRARAHQSTRSSNSSSRASKSAGSPSSDDEFVGPVVGVGGGRDSIKDAHRGDLGVYGFASLCCASVLGRLAYMPSPSPHTATMLSSAKPWQPLMRSVRASSFHTLWSRAWPT